MSLTDVNRYAFINAKLRLRIANMLSDEQIQHLAASQNLEQMLHLLKGSAFEELATLFSESGDIQRLEAWLFARNVDIHRQVASLLDGVHSIVATQLSRKLEVENLKGMIRLWFSSRIKAQNIDYRYGYLYHKKIVSDIDWSAIINAQTFEELTHALLHSPYYSVVQQFDAHRITSEGLFFLETALDRQWVSLLRQEARKLPAVDRHLVQEVLDRDADLKNCINLVRFGYLYALTEAQLREIMFYGGKLLFTKEFNDFVTAEPAKRTIEPLLVRLFPQLAKQLAEQNLQGAHRQTIAVESYLFSQRRSRYKAMLKGYPFTFGTLLSYFFLEERQHALIRAIINGLHYGYKAEQIREYAQ
ncbi:MAG: V-type ATPase subunit [Sphaerochaetaceae bacterium]